MTRELVWPSIGKGREATWKPPAYAPAFVHFFKAATSLIQLPADFGLSYSLASSPGYAHVFNIASRKEGGLGTQYHMHGLAHRETVERTQLSVGKADHQFLVKHTNKL